MSVRILIGDVREQLATLADDSVDCVCTSPPYWGLRKYLPAGHPDEKFEIGMEPTLGEHLAVMVEVFREVRRVLKPTGTLWLNYGDCYATSPNGRSAADTKAAGNDDRTFRDKPFSTIQGSLKPKDLAMIPNRLAISLQEPEYKGHIESEADRIWLAAMIDGEGSIYIHRQPVGSTTGRDRKYKRKQDGFCVGIAISNTSEAIVRKFAAICGKDNIQRIAAKGGNRREHFHWRVTGNIAKSILHEVYPHLVAKQREARIAIACPPSGDEATAIWEALKDIHKGRPTEIDAPAPDPKLLWQPGWWVRSEIVWAKPNPMPESIKDRPGNSHEKVWLLSKSPKYFYDYIAVRQPIAAASVARLAQDVENQHGSDRANGGAKTNGKMKAVRFGGNKGGGEHGSFQRRASGREWESDGETANLRNVWTIATAAFSEAHFATFPPELAERCIKAGCPAGGTVLDPFGGAGTTGLVADRLGRNAILIELNPEYAAMAERRIKGDAPLFTEVA